MAICPSLSLPTDSAEEATYLRKSESAQPYIQRAIEISKKSEQSIYQIISHGVHGFYYLYQNELGPAIDSLKRGERLTVNRFFLTYYQIELWVTLADAYLRRAEKDRRGPRKVQADLKAARKAICFAKRKAVPYPNYMGLLECLEGRERWLRGRYRAAKRSFSKGISTLESTEASYFIGSTHLEIGRLILRHEPNEGRKHLRKAEQILAHTEAREELAQVHMLLNDGSDHAETTEEAMCPEGPSVEHSEPLSPSIMAFSGVETLANAIRLVAEAKEQDELIEGILDLCIDSTGAERAFVVVYEIPGDLERRERKESSEDMEKKPLIRIARNLERSRIDWESIQYSRSTIRHVIQTGKSVVVADACSDNRFSLEAEVARQQMRSILCVPLKRFDEVFGMLYLDNRLLPNLFCQEHLELISVIADQTAMAIQNIMNLNRLKDDKLEIRRLKRRGRDEVALQGKDIEIEHDFEEIVSSSDEMKSVLKHVEKVAPLETTVIIRGESGTGKDLVARAIHNLSPRRDRSMVTVNCAALPEGLLESELFGHERGAFTDAHRRKIGRFEVAQGSSIFLDEIGELTQKLQTKLLRVLQEKEFERVGGIETIKADVRIITATNRNLEEAIEKGRFREDLFYRLNVLPIHIPPLRERREDISLLVAYFVNKLCSRYRREFTGVDKDSMEAMLRYDWPGNVRELQNVIERSMILCEGPILCIHEFELEESVEPHGNSKLKGDFYEAVKEFKRQMIRDAIRISDGRKSAAARRLGIAPNYLSRLIRQLKIE